VHRPRVDHGLDHSAATRLSRHRCEENLGVVGEQAQCRELVLHWRGRRNGGRAGTVAATAASAAASASGARPSTVGVQRGTGVRSATRRFATAILPRRPRGHPQVSDLALGPCKRLLLELNNVCSSSCVCSLS
jgi:hypothetical protein